MIVGVWLVLCVVESTEGYAETSAGKCPISTAICLREVTKVLLSVHYFEDTVKTPEVNYLISEMKSELEEIPMQKLVNEDNYSVFTPHDYGMKEACKNSEYMYIIEAHEIKDSKYEEAEKSDRKVTRYFVQ